MMGRRLQRGVSSVCRIVLLTAALMCLGSPVLAQSQGRVVKQGSPVWRADVSLIALTLSVGTLLDITAQSELWYEVIIPTHLGGRGERGLIVKSQVQLLPESPEPPVRSLRGNPAGSSVPPAAARPPQAAARQVTTEPAIAVRGFAQGAYTVLTARKSFEAVLQKAHGPSFGGGAQVRGANGVFVQLSWERFQETGQRVFVFEDTVFPLGVPNTITIMPLTITGGYRFVRRAPAIPYLGGGFARYRLQETTPFSNEDDEVDERYWGQQVLGGVEFRLGRWMAAAVEGQYTRVPNALGVGGVSAVFDEHDLGGLQVQMKLLFGR